MCGIAGCVGHEVGPSFVLDALEELEYRGYDSAGIGFLENGQLRVEKTVGSPTNLRNEFDQPLPQSDLAIGHNRWATHGRVTTQNAHPHTNELGSIAVVCNGTIENYKLLKDALLNEGHVFTSQTDTEIVPHLIESYLSKDYGPEEAFEATLKRLAGAYAILAVMSETPDRLYAARVGSPLVLGTNENDSSYAASDITVLRDHADKFLYLKDYEFAAFGPNGLAIKHLEEDRHTTRALESLDDILTEDHAKAELGDYPHFMLKEIYDSAETVHSATRGRVLPEEGIIKLGGLESVRDRLRETERVIIVACGTSRYAGLIGEQLIEQVAGLPVEVEEASEFAERDAPIDTNTAVIAISQSGETADTIEALKKAKTQNLLTLGVVNVPGSTISRMTDAGVYCRAGQEVSVASTKAFISQVTVLSEVAMYLARKSNQLNKPLMQELIDLPAKIDILLADTDHIKEVAIKYATARDFLFIGRGYNYPVAMEGALKLKEISYIHAEGYSSGEMKHGPLAMIDENFPTFAVATNSPQLPKLMSNIEEIKARKGPVVAIATEGNEAIREIVDDVIYVPESLEQTQPIINAIAEQLFAYYIAVEKGLNVDRPRNLAKSVTVQ
jgi:glucosamine--fructose-6-phosphate aminotransferase (isomerizing)